MDLVSPIVDVFNRVWDCTVKRSDPIRHLRENLQSLEEAKRELEAISRDVESNVSQIEEQLHSRRTNQVKDWLETVDRTLKEVEDTLQRGDQEIKTRCLGNWCPKNCCSTYKLGKEVIQKLFAVKELISKRRDFHVLADKLPPAAVDVRPMEKTVGTESRFSQLWRYVQDHSVGIIGIYGMGGVGKTTLLKKLNNKFMDTKHDFDLVIWVVVSKEVNLLKIQEVIRTKVGISDEMWKQRNNEDDRAAELYKKLSNKKFVLLLDDIWQRIDLSKVGVPVLDKCKIVFTTRSEDVCNHMEAHQRFKVECLSPEVAWELFQQKLGKDALNSHHEIPKLAKIIVNECKGLPLALITIGRAMASRRKLEEWQHAIKLLQSYPFEFPGMEDMIFNALNSLELKSLEEPIYLFGQLFQKPFERLTLGVSSALLKLLLLLLLKLDWAHNHSGDPEIESALKRGEDLGLALEDDGKLMSIMTGLGLAFAVHLDACLQSGLNLLRTNVMC
ncbi:hypothetical protein LWI28_018970 [Acer negundo]|uniref:NB-ARC domain-containing protein n=1 Tax=Acer negundo TaxID=4023 RepID=A0AAD5IEX4_ACENE|nr:hypothetical protein LWI28_018970 [Acer negundo]